MTNHNQQNIAFKAGCHHPLEQPKKKRSQISFHFTNIRGLRTNFDDLLMHSTRHKPAVIAVTEPLLTETVPDIQILLPSYHPPVRKNRPKGGIVLYVHESFSFVHLNDLSSPEHDFLWLKLSLGPKENVYLCCLYRSPSADDSIYDLLTAQIQNFYAEDPACEVVVLGDFNAHHKTWLGFSKNTDVHGEAALLFSLSNDLTQMVSCPTRFPSHSLLDLFLTSSPELYVVSTVAPLGTSDHAVVCCTRSIESSTTKVAKRGKRLFNKADWNALCNFFSDYNWTSCENDDVDVYATNITTVIQLGMDLFIPTKVMPTTETSAPWFNLPCFTAYSKKQAAYRKWKSKPSAATQSAFKAARNNLKKVIRQAKKDFQTRLQGKINSNQLTPRHFWSMYRNLSGVSKPSIPTLSAEGQASESPLEKAELLNSLFSANSTLDAGSKVPPKLTPRTNHSLHHVNFHLRTTYKILKKLDMNKAEGADCIPTVVLKKCSFELALPLTKLFAHSFRKGKVPASWKFAVVQPVPKPGDNKSPLNYRPISLLPVMGKVMERVVNQSIVSFLRHHNLLNDRQYGFLSERSTTDLLTVLFQTWTDALDSGSEVRAISLDISKAFDKVWHDGLLAKLQSHGIGGPLFNWLKDYLSNRSQAVRVDGIISESKSINAGVPQGSVLGPTLFLIFINDLLDITSNPIHSFADDSTLHVRLPPGPLTVARQEAAVTLDSDLAKIDEWGEQWLVSFNAKKTTQLAISRRSDQNYPASHFQESELQFASEMKLLGITFSGKLSLEKHVHNKLSAAARMIGVLYRLRRILPLSSMLQLYKSLIRPHLEYCSHLLDSASKGSLLLIEKLQSRAMRILGCSDPVKENILPMSHRRNVGCLSLLYRYFHGHCSRELLGLVPTLQHLGPSTRFAGVSHSFCLSVPRSRTEHHKKSFFPRTIRLWNSLPSSAFPVDYNLVQFKKNVNCFLKTQLH
jgi:hypothetical protein